MSKGQAWLPVVLLVGLIIIVGLLGVLTTGFVAGKAVNEIVANLGSYIIFGFLLSGLGILSSLIISSAATNPTLVKAMRILSTISVFLFMLVLVAAEVAIVQVVAPKDILKPYQSCTGLTSPVATGGIGGRIIQTASCALTGAVGKTIPASINLWIFSFLIPLTILGLLFVDFVQASGIIASTTSQTLIGWGLGFLAYRGFVVTNLLAILDLGAMGAALVAFDLLLVGGILGLTRRAFQAHAPMFQAERVRTSAKLSKANLVGILDELDNLTIDRAKELLSQNVYLFEVLDVRDLFDEMMKAQTASDMRKAITRAKTEIKQRTI